MSPRLCWPPPLTDAGLLTCCSDACRAPGAAPSRSPAIQSMTAGAASRSSRRKRQATAEPHTEPPKKTKTGVFGGLAALAHPARTRSCRSSSRANPAAPLQRPSVFVLQAPVGSLPPPRQHRPRPSPPGLPSTPSSQGTPNPPANANPPTRPTTTRPPPPAAAGRAPWLTSRPWLQRARTAACQ